MLGTRLLQGILQHEALWFSRCSCYHRRMDVDVTARDVCALTSQAFGVSQVNVLVFYTWYVSFAMIRNVTWRETPIKTISEQD